MAHNTKTGGSRLLDQCSLPLTGKRCVTRVYTSRAVIDIEDSKFVLREKLPGITLDALQAVTGATLHIVGEVAELNVPEGIS